MGSHGLHNRKEYPHEESVRIPAIFHAPGRLPAQGIVDGLFSLVDLLPTTLGLAGASVPPWVQGVDFSPLLRGDRSFAGPDQVLIEMVNNPRWTIAMPDCAASSRTSLCIRCTRRARRCCSIWRTIRINFRIWPATHQVNRFAISFASNC